MGQVVTSIRKPMGHTMFGSSLNLKHPSFHKLPSHINDRPLWRPVKRLAHDGIVAQKGLSCCASGRANVAVAVAVVHMKHAKGLDPSWYHVDS